jgi:hypothetical protein
MTLEVEEHEDRRLSRRVMYNTILRYYTLQYVKCAAVAAGVLKNRPSRRWNCRKRRGVTINTKFD